MNETTDNFWEAFKNWEVPETKPALFRLYYNDQGRPLFYSMEEFPGNYIDVDRETYVLGSMNVKVVDNKLIKLQTHYYTKLVPSDTGTACDPRDVCVVVDSTPNTKWSLKTNDPN
jgi:hypothetical protein